MKIKLTGVHVDDQEKALRCYDQAEGDGGHIHPMRSSG